MTQDLHIHFETHATTLDNETGLASGWFDVDLSPQGVEQARALALRRSAVGLAAIYCSDLRRSCRTAVLAYGGAGVPILRDARLRECDYGTLTRSPVWLIESCRGKYVDTPFPRGESYEQVTSGVGAWLNEAISRWAGRTILVIGHRATQVALEHLIRGVPLEAAVTARRPWRPGWEYRYAGERTQP